MRADRTWFEEVRRQHGADVAALEFPRYAAGAQLRADRRAAWRSGGSSRSRGTTPEIDLAGLDPGVSAVHALLVARSDGGWDLVDLGSTNGTTLRSPTARSRPHVPVPLADGAVVHLGAWTTITLTTTA